MSFVPVSVLRCQLPFEISITILLSPVDNTITVVPTAVKIPKQYSVSPIWGLDSDMHVGDDTPCNLHADSWEHIVADSMCCECVLHRKSVLPYWPSNQNVVSAAVAQMCQRGKPRTDWLIHTGSWLPIWPMRSKTMAIFQTAGSGLPPTCDTQLLCNKLRLPARITFAPVAKMQDQVQSSISTQRMRYNKRKLEIKIRNGQRKHFDVLSYCLGRFKG